MCNGCHDMSTKANSIYNLCDVIYNLIMVMRIELILYLCLKAMH